MSNLSNIKFHYIVFLGLFFFVFFILFNVNIAYGEEVVTPLKETSFFSKIQDQFESGVKQWSSTLLEYAKSLFVVLATISLTWHFGLMALRKADITEFIAELFKKQTLKTVKNE